MIESITIRVQPYVLVSTSDTPCDSRADPRSRRPVSRVRPRRHERVARIGDRGLILFLAVHTDQPPLRSGKHSCAGLPFGEGSLALDGADELGMFLALLEDEALLPSESLVLSL